MSRRRLGSSMLACVAGVLLLGVTARLSLQGAGAVVTATPEEVRLSPQRLARIRGAGQGHSDAGVVSGAVARAGRHGRIVHLGAQGLRDLESKRPMPKDGVFGLASMSKPITAVAVMMLVEEGKVRLNDPVSRFIP